MSIPPVRVFFLLGIILAMLCKLCWQLSSYAWDLLLGMGLWTYISCSFITQMTKGPCNKTTFNTIRVLKDVEKRNRRGQVESHHCDDRIRFYTVWSENPMPNRMHPKMPGTNERAVFVHFQTLHVWVYLPI